MQPPADTRVGPYDRSAVSGISAARGTPRRASTQAIALTASTTDAHHGKADRVALRRRRGILTAAAQRVREPEADRRGGEPQ